MLPGSKADTYVLAYSTGYAYSIPPQEAIYAANLPPALPPQARPYAGMAAPALDLALTAITTPSP